MYKRDPHSSLRASLDGNDSFLSGGHGVKTPGATRHAERMRRVPVWAFDDKKIAELIKARFPKAATNLDQRKLAARMLRLIHLYYRVGDTTATVAEQLGMSINAVDCALRRLNRSMANKILPSHRPKKADGIRAPIEGSGEDHLSL